MNDIIVMAFTSKGYALAEKIAGLLASDSNIYSNAGFNVSARRVNKLKEFVPDIFKKGNILIFVGSAGIAVRG